MTKKFIIPNEELKQAWKDAEGYPQGIFIIPNEELKLFSYYGSV